MANTWFRLYSEFAHDPKVQILSEAYQRRLIMLFCLRCSGQETLLDEYVAFQLRIDKEEWSKTKSDFIRLGFIDDECRIMHWDKRQFLSDSSATRVQKHRENRKAKGLSSQDWIAPKIRDEIFLRDENTCIYCGSVVDLTIDHRTPTCRGGENKKENLQVCCRRCNADKRHMTHEEYLAWPGRVTLLKRPQITDTDTEADTEKQILELTLLSPPAPAPRPEDFANIWNKLRGNLPKVTNFTNGRKAKVKTRMHAGLTLEHFTDAIRNCHLKPFLRGDNDSGWTATFDWLVRNNENVEKAINQPYGLNLLNGDNHAAVPNGTGNKLVGVLEKTLQRRQRERSIDENGDLPPIVETRRDDAGIIHASLSQPRSQSLPSGDAESFKF